MRRRGGILYPDDAVDNLRDQQAALGQRWYRTGARRGALQILEAFLHGKLVLRTDKHGEVEIVARPKSVAWKRSLRVRVGNQKRTVPKRRNKLTLKDVGFDL